MRSFCVNSARSCIGKTVNIHLKVGSTIPAVKVRAVKKTEHRNKNNRSTFAIIEVKAKNQRIQKFKLDDIAYAEPIMETFPVSHYATHLKVPRGKVEPERLPSFCPGRNPGTHYLRRQTCTRPIACAVCILENVDLKTDPKGNNFWK